MIPSKFKGAIINTINFTANGASTIIDQVVVNNLTQGTSVTVPAGSTLLLIDATSVPQLNVNESLHISPNPILTKAKVSFYSEKGGLTKINVFGMDGRRIMHKVENLQSGDNEFMLSLPKGVFVLHINDKENTHKAKVISQNFNHAAIEFSDRKATSDVVAQKVNSSIINMNYNAGDILIFKAYSGNFVSIIADVIVADKTVNFKMVECIDQEGNYYPVVTIGTQTWLAENLNTSRFRNNVAIADKTNDPSWGTTTSAAYSDYASPSTSRTYGKLYNGYTVTDQNNLAPVGWHIPTDADWTILSDYLGGLSNAGSKLKEKGNSHWMIQNSDATNETGFTALPGGTRSTDGNMYDFGSIGYWWSITEGSNINSSWYRFLQNSSGSLFRAFYNKNAGMSVRCVMGDLAMLSTSGVSSITATTATGGGDVSFDGNLEVIAKGVCWSTSTNPTIDNSKTVDGGSTGTFNSTITGLTINNTYYVRAYATNSFGTAYGSQVSFSTKTPTLTTTVVTSLTSTSAVSGGSISSIGGSAVTERGVCWSTSPNPTIEDSKTTNGSGSGDFTSSISGLTHETTYYVRAYAINSIGTSYGAEKSLTTLSGRVSLSTNTLSSIGSTYAISGGKITDDGGSPVTARGVCWSTTQNPTTKDFLTSDGSGIGNFTSIMNGLRSGTAYFVKAYAINLHGTSYGNILTFKTIDGIPELNTTNVTLLTDTSAISGGTITHDGGTPITACGVCWSTTRNPTINDNITIDSLRIGNYSSNLTGLKVGIMYFVRAYATNSVGTAYGKEVKYYNPKEGEVFNSITGRVWMDRNLGASRVATSSTDADAYGDLYQWGRGTDGHEKRTSLTTSTLSDSDTPGHGMFIITSYGEYPNDWRSPHNENLWQGINGVNNPCPEGFRLPTSNEWQAEYKSWSSQNSAGAFDSPLKLTIAGKRSYIGKLSGVDLSGSYWSSDNGSDSTRSFDFYSSGANTSFNAYTFGYGLSVRCIKD